jgi:oligopeptidase B
MAEFLALDAGSRCGAYRISRRFIGSLTRLALGLSLWTTALAAEPAPPKPERIPHTREIHDRTLTDEYFWIREQKNPKVIEHLKAENAYTAAMMAHLKPLEEKLYNEFLSRIKQTDLSVPYLDNGYYYYSRTVEGKSYSIYCRKKGTLDAAEEVLLDVNALAEGKPTMFARPLAISPDNLMLAYSEDPTGGRRLTIRFKNLETGALCPDTIENAAGPFAWFNDGRTYVYTVLDHAVRSYRCFRGRLGEDPTKAESVWEEADERFSLGINRSRSDAFIFLASGSMKSTEWRFISTDEPTGQFRMIEPRRPDVEYSVEHHADSFYILHNDGAINFTLVQAPLSSPSRANWKTVIAHRDDSYLTGVDAFKNHLVLSTRERGLPTLRVRRLSDGEEHAVSFPETSYATGVSMNAEFDTDLLRLRYASMITPDSIFDYNVKSRERTLLKEQPVLGGYDRKLYTTERLYAKAADGAEVPVALVYRVDGKRQGGNPLLLVSYGSYGAPTDASFNSNNISLLDRGVVYAQAQIRGGSDKGRLWYEQGRLRNKMNTFTDFIAAAEHLVDRGYTRPDQLAIRGGSAGGLLIGAVLNMKPELFRAAMADVPFVDVINTMLDDDLPLTVTEFEQWGNPREKGDFDYMIRYSPYDNVAARPYPAILSMTGLHDSQVSYWEPTKWVARLRDKTTAKHPILLKVNLEAAHGGASGRYERLRENAFRMSWLLDQVGIRE